MDPEKPIEEQFSKLHPCLSLDTRIAIIGGGPSGLSAAYALTKLGYTNITVLEEYHSVGGMCESVDIRGKVYDLGGQVLAANSAPVIFHLAKETQSELHEMDSHKLAFIDSSTGQYQDLKVADDYTSVISLTLKLQDRAKSSGRIGVHAVSEFAWDPSYQYLEANGVKTVPKALSYGYTASGYGFVQHMPYAYVHEFTRTSMAGKIRRFANGYTSLWKKISEALPIKLHCNTQVLTVKRDSDRVRVDARDNTNGEIKSMEFDKIIISGSFPFQDDSTVDLSDLEKDLFSKVKTMDYYTTVMKIKGLDHLPIGFYYFGAHIDDPTKVGYPVAMQRFYSDTEIFLFWSYGNSLDIVGPNVTEIATEMVQNMGGQVEEVVLQRRFKYFPHVNSQDMKDGFYDKLECELQGSRNTYYVGGLMAFELTERNSSYSMALVCKHFATKDSKPIFPYVKSLFPLQEHRLKRNSGRLEELPGVEFPDLPSLDCYLNHWGTHKVTRNRTLYTWIDEGGAETGRRTFQDLHHNATLISKKLLANKNPVINQGDRVLLVYLPGLDFIDAFLGCLRAKVLPVPVLPPDPFQRGGQALQKIENIAKSCQAVAILSTVGYHSAVLTGKVKFLVSLGGKKGNAPAKWPKLPWIKTDSWVKTSKSSMGKEETVNQTEAHPEKVCFLQFTSGSTGDAKGVMITQGGLIHNVKLMRRTYNSTSKTVLVSWLPQYHDMGLIGGLFTALVSGGSAVLFSPMTFIRNPLLWLETLTKYRATHSAGPNFAFELLIRRLESNACNALRNYDLSSMVFLMVSAEPVRHKTVKRFIELGRSFGLSEYALAPGYGLAENSVFVSCAFGQEKPVLLDWEERVCCGYLGPKYSKDVDIRIVNPDSGKEILEQGEEGEIWISSPSAGVGYWGRDDLSRKTFGNELQNRLGYKYTRTGDLGRIIDNKLFITGRIKDLIIVAGRNIYSSDVEKTVEGVSNLLRPGCCAVIGVPEETLSAKGVSIPESADHVGLVVIAEVKDGKPVTGDVVEEIKTRVAEEHGISVATVEFIKPRTISKTTSGKIMRFDCLKQFTEGTLKTVPNPIRTKRVLSRSLTTGTCAGGMTPRPQLLSSPIQRTSTNTKSKDDIVKFLKGLVSEQTGISVSNISTTENLVSYGIDSIGVVRAAQKLSDFLGVPIGAVDIFTATCISELASFSENLLSKSQPEKLDPEFEMESDLDFATEVSKSRHISIWLLQSLALIYVAFLISFPAYLSLSSLKSSVSSTTGMVIPFPEYLFPLALAPLAWIVCMVLTNLCVSILGNSFLRPNYALSPEISIWSVEFVKWWALYKAQEVSSKILGQNLRGTVFLKYWFEMFGARIGSSVLIDTIDITDPSLVSIGDGAVISEGVLIQSHDVKHGILSFSPTRIGRNSCVGPYAVIQKGGGVGDGIQVMALQKTGVKPVSCSTSKGGESSEAIKQLFGIYVVGFVNTLSSAILYLIYISATKRSHSPQLYTFLCAFGAFHWLPYAVIAYITILPGTSSDPIQFALLTAVSYLSHGLILTILTQLSTNLISPSPEEKTSHFKTWLCHRIRISCHLRFAKLLSGTEAFCVYLRFLGAKIGRHCSIRAINPVSNPKLISMGHGVHLGDFSKVVTGFYSSSGFVSNGIEIGDNSVVGSQSVLLPGSTMESDVILGALSVAPEGSILRRGGVYVGSDTPVMVKNMTHALDDRIEEMDAKYKMIVGNLSANLAATTLKVKSRYFHRIGVGGRGKLKMYGDDDNNASRSWLRDHEIFGAGRTYDVILRHSNSLSADDDARIDARGAAVRILSGDGAPVLDLTLKTGDAFYARTISDFATWLVCGVEAREEHVTKRAPHVGRAVWTSLRHADSYTELHYYSNICRLLRFSDGREVYAKFKLRPYDRTIGEDSGKVEPTGVLPPETGAISRDEGDNRPLLFLADDFRRRVGGKDGVRYVFQVQFREVPEDEAARDSALDCTQPWDQAEFPYVDFGEIEITENLTAEEAENLDFNPYLGCREVDVIRATSYTQSASIDHGRSLVYEICQHLRNGKPLPESWRAFIQQSDVKVDLSGCPMALNSAPEEEKRAVALEREWYVSLWSTIGQPLIQTASPYFLLGLVISEPLKWLFYLAGKEWVPLYWLIPLFWVASGSLATLACVGAKWALVGRRREGESVQIWSARVLMDTTWQALRTLAGEYFLEMTSGSSMFLVWMRLMGCDVEWDQGAYVDSVGVLLNPEMVEIGSLGSVGREALLFGHVYEGEAGKVKFGKVKVGECGFVGSRAVAMPGSSIESFATLSALSLAMKQEVIKSTSNSNSNSN